MSEYIPDTLSIDQVNELAKRIRPVVLNEGRLWNIQTVPVWTASFLWEPLFTTQADGLIVLQDITTYHTFGFQGFFKPTIAEVIRQIPPDILDTVDAFEVIRYPESAYDLDQQLEELNQGYHVATVRLYRDYHIATTTAI